MSLKDDIFSHVHIYHHLAPFKKTKSTAGAESYTVTAVSGGTWTVADPNTTKFQRILNKQIAAQQRAKKRAAKARKQFDRKQITGAQLSKVLKEGLRFSVDTLVANVKAKVVSTLVSTTHHLH